MAEDRNNSQGFIGQAHTVRKTKRSCQISIRFILVDEAGGDSLLKRNGSIGKKPKRSNHRDRFAFEFFSFRVSASVKLGT